MSSRHKQNRILWYESIGFILLILLSWADEIFCLPYLLFGGGECHPNWRESATETVVIIIVFIPLFILTKQLSARLFLLEDFLRICAWCRKICYENEWLPMEEYFAKGFDMQTTHGVCPACAEKIVDEMSHKETLSTISHQSK